MGEKRREGERKGEGGNKNPPSDRSGYGPVNVFAYLLTYLLDITMAPVE